jgi:hypothetical protein
MLKLNGENLGSSSPAVERRFLGNIRMSWNLLLRENKKVGCIFW